MAILTEWMCPIIDTNHATGSRITEGDVEDATLEWLEGLGYGVRHGPRPTNAKRPH